MYYFSYHIIRQLQIMAKYTEKKLQQTIIYQQIEKEEYFYTLVEKPRTTFSFTSKNRLIIFCKTYGFLTYVEEQRAPFQKKESIPMFGKDKADVKISSIFNQPSKANLIVKYPKHNEKGQRVFTQWEFLFKNKKIAKQWEDMLNKYVQEKNKIQSPVKNVMAEIMMPKKEEKEKQEEIDGFFLNNSSLRKDKQESQVKNPPEEKDNEITDPKESKEYFEPPKKISESHVSMPDIYKSHFSNQSKNLGGSNPLNQSRMSTLSRKVDKKQLESDWNYKLIVQPQLSTVESFQARAYDAFEAILKDDKQKTAPLRQYESFGLLVNVADSFTPEAKLLKKQFRNYHYILQCSKGNFYLGVPLSVLIEYNGFVALVKAPFPPSATPIKYNTSVKQTMGQLSEVTRINNSILNSPNCTLYDLTEAYGPIDDRPRIYVNQLIQFMPELTTITGESYFLRPQFLQCYIKGIIPGGSLEGNRMNKVRNQITNIQEKQFGPIVSYLSGEDIFVTNYFDLKEYLHYQGINMKNLPQIFIKTQNKFLKRYLQTVLIAKIVKDEIILRILMKRKEESNYPPEKVIESTIKALVEGKSASNNELWKKMALTFRRNYGVAMNTHEIVGGFFLSCVMSLVKADYNIQKIDKSKYIFQDNQIIEEGFVRRSLPKIKSFYRFWNQTGENISEICKFTEKNRTVYNDIVDRYSLKNKKLPPEFSLNNSNLYILAYLSEFTSPSGIGNSTLACSPDIYELVNFQPPSSPTLKITLNYLIYCIENKKDEEFEKTVKKAQQIVHYWLGYEHPHICEIYDLISDNESRKGDTGESIKILEKALAISEKTEGKNKKQIGMRYHALGDRQLRSRRKKQAMENFMKAKSSLEEASEKVVEYPVTLMKISSLYLNNGDLNSCTDMGQLTLSVADQTDLRDTYIIKTYQILCRAYEIQGEKDELRKLSLRCGKVFNSTDQPKIYLQMLKIGLTGSIANLSNEKTVFLMMFVDSLKEEGEIISEEKAISQLMQMSRKINVMEKFILKCEFVEKLWNDVTHKRSLAPEYLEFLRIMKLMTSAVGVDFIRGLAIQKDYE